MLIKEETEAWVTGIRWEVVKTRARWKHWKLEGEEKFKTCWKIAETEVAD